MLVVFLVQAQILWPWQNRVADSFRAGLPSNLSWIDDEVGGDVARMVLIDNPIRAQTTEFFNYDIKRTYMPAGPVLRAARQRPAVPVGAERGRRRRLGRGVRPGAPRGCCSTTTTQARRSTTRRCSRRSRASGASSS